MHSTPPPAALDLVLIGGGHAHVHVLKMWAMRRLSNRPDNEWFDCVQLTLISPQYHTPYSGMLPGYLAGHYTHDEIHLDLSRLARLCGARLICAAACAITYNENGSGGGWITTTDGRPPIRYDCLSIDIGSAPSSICSNDIIPVKPIATFCQQYEAVVQDYVNAVNASDCVVATDGDDPTTTTAATKLEPYRIAIVGGGAGGVELVLSLDYRLRSKLDAVSTTTSRPPRPFELVLLTHGPDVLPSHNARVRQRFCRILQQRHIRLVTHAHVSRVESVESMAYDSLQPTKRIVYTVSAAASSSASSTTVSSTAREEANKSNFLLVHACFWCTTASAAPWLAQATPFATNAADHCLRVRDTHELLAPYRGVFAAGDCCHMDDHPRPKAGVYAVRAGPILYDNLVRYCTGRPLRHYTPQRTCLGLIATGNQYAVASKGRWFSLQGAWLWNVKDCIDRTWMAKYSTDLPDRVEMMAAVEAKGSRQRRTRYGASSAATNPVLRLKRLDEAEQAVATFASDPMRCGGCGAKVGSTIVARVLNAVHQRQVVRAQQLGYRVPERMDHDDAAITVLPPHPSTTSHSQPTQHTLIQTIDYFRELVKDPFTFGKIVAVHALSDMHAMGASASTALTLAVVPFAADEAITESNLLHLLSGVSDVLQDEGIVLVGGHTCEGQELACGLSLMGYTNDPGKLLRKRGGRVGDSIVLTKPLGTGALFAADMRARAKGQYAQEAIESMLQSSFKASVVAKNLDGVHACTDVTGFGLIGHLLEMLMANVESELEDIGACLCIDNMRFYRGGLEASAKGIFSTLQQQNARNRRAIVNHSEAAQRYPVEYPLLFDPQTAGGLMLFVDPANCAEFLALLGAENVEAYVIGSVEEYSSAARSPAQSFVGGTDDAPVCTIGSGTTATGQRIRILCL
jgi:selenide, water dikinase